MPRIRTPAVQYAGFALCLLLTGLGLTAYGENGERSSPEPGEARADEGERSLSAGTASACTSASQSAAVNRCPSTHPSALPVTPTHLPADDDAASGDSAVFEAKTCKRPGKRCKVARPTDCCSLTCLCPVGEKHCTCG